MTYICSFVSFTKISYYKYLLAHILSPKESFNLFLVCLLWSDDWAWLNWIWKREEKMNLKITQTKPMQFNWLNIFLFGFFFNYFISWIFFDFFLWFFIPSASCIHSFISSTHLHVIIIIIIIPINFSVLIQFSMLFHKNTKKHFSSFFF